MQNIGDVTFICGPHGSGKSYIGEILSSEDSALLHFECGPTIRKLHAMSGSTLCLHEWISECNELHKTNYVEKSLRNELLDAVSLHNNDAPIIVSGVRSMGHIRYICEPWEIANPSIVYIDCDTRKSRQNCIYRENRAISQDDIDSFLQHDYEMGLLDIKAYVIENPDECMLLVNDDNHIEKYMSRIRAILYRNIGLGVMK